jgi:3-hydroxybutyryl-CoA dehydrogenase
MRIFIEANEEQKTEIQSVINSHKKEMVFSQSPASIIESEYDAFFFLTDFWKSINFKNFSKKPVIIHSVIDTLSQLKIPENTSRINAWPGFLQRSLWEVASNDEQKIQPVFEWLGQKIIYVKDEPGFAAARVISMIVNEAFFAVGERVSTEIEIDLAMKLGTNYPNGPFEWAQKIGVKNIYDLLERLSEKEKRYLPAPALKELYLQKIHS